MDKILSDYDPGMAGQPIENMEMEASFLLHFLAGLDYWAGAICAVIANRRTNAFDSQYQESVENSIKIALLALANLRSRYPNHQIR